MTQKIVITGAPCSGKTALLEALQLHIPDAFFLPEAATIVIENELRSKERDDSYQMRVPWIDYLQFAPVVTAKSEEMENLIPETVGLSFQDRGHIDTVAFCRINSVEEYLPVVLPKIDAANYSFAFLCEPLDVYVATDVRRETPEKAYRTHIALKQAYKELGMDIVPLPAVSIEERLNLVIQALNERGLI